MDILHHTPLESLLYRKIKPYKNIILYCFPVVIVCCRLITVYFIYSFSGYCSIYNIVIMPLCFTGTMQ